MGPDESSRPEVDSVNRSMFRMALVVPAKAYPGGESCIHIDRVFAAHLEQKVSLRKSERNREHTVHHSQLWFGDGCQA